MHALHNGIIQGADDDLLRYIVIRRSENQLSRGKAHLTGTKSDADVLIRHGASAQLDGDNVRATALLDARGAVGVGDDDGRGVIVSNGCHDLLDL